LQIVSKAIAWALNEAPYVRTRKDMPNSSAGLEAVGLTVESTPGHHRVLREGKPLRKAKGMPFTLPFSPDTIRWRRAEFALVELNVAVAELDGEVSLEHEEEIVGVVVLVPDELSPFTLTRRMSLSLKPATIFGCQCSSKRPSLSGQVDFSFTRPPGHGWRRPNHLGWPPQRGSRCATNSAQVARPNAFAVLSSGVAP
jgi:hypothetical protein